MKIFTVNYADPSADYANMSEINYRDLDVAVTSEPVELRIYDPEGKGYRGAGAAFSFPSGLNSPNGYRLVVRNMEKHPIKLYGGDTSPLPDEGAREWQPRNAAADWCIINESPVVDFDGGVWGGFDIRGWGRGGLLHSVNGRNTYRGLSIRDNGDCKWREVEYTGKMGYVPIHKDCAIRLNAGNCTFYDLQVHDAAGDVFQVGSIERIENVTVDGYLFTYRIHNDYNRAYNDTTHPDHFQQWKAGSTVRNLFFNNGIMGAARQWLIFGNASKVENVTVNNSILVGAYGIGFRAGDECDNVLIANSTVYSADKDLLLAWAESSRGGRFLFDNCILYSATGRFKVKADGDAKIESVNTIANKVVDELVTTVQPIYFEKLPSSFGVLDFDFTNSYEQGADFGTVAQLLAEGEPYPPVTDGDFQAQIDTLRNDIVQLRSEIELLKAENAQLTEDVKKHGFAIQDLVLAFGSVDSYLASYKGAQIISAREEVDFSNSIFDDG